MTDTDAEAYTVKELADRAGVTPRTVYYYVSEGLLPPPEGGGPASVYRDEHLNRLRLIRRLKDEFLPLAEIRRRLAGLSGEDLRALLAEPAPAPPTESALDYLDRLLGPRPSRLEERPTPMLHRATAASEPASPMPPPLSGAPVDRSAALLRQEDWRRIRIGPWIELHVRRDAPPSIRKNLSTIVETLRRLTS